MTGEELVAVVVFVAMAVFGFYASWAFRRGRLRRGARWYFDRYQPDFVRNLPFVLLPWAIANSAAAVVIVSGNAAGFLAEVAVTIGSVVLLIGLILMVVFVVKPPRFLKPDWLVEREESARTH